MNRIAWATRLVRVMGPRWVLFRGAYALRQRAGWDARRLPVTTWDAVSLSSVVRRGAPSDHDEYAAFRQHTRARFFFPDRLSVNSHAFANWDAGAYDAVRNAARVSAGEYPFFDHDWLACGRPPDWHRNPFTGARVQATGHWSGLDEFASGDIKPVWELNRFAFVFALVRAYWRTGDSSLAECFWQLVEDWCAHNPPQAGMNWKCGQESSIRAMAWCVGLYGFEGAAAQTPVRRALLTRMLAVTGRRVASNLTYALSQGNNHGISEAAGLWTIGTLFPELRDAERWQDLGRTALESQARELIYDDGGFSQHSANYHRVMLEVYLWCIQLGRANGVELTASLVHRVGQAGRWIESLQDSDTGRLPNWGSNDGAHILPFSNCGYLDYRPAAQAAAVVTSGRRALPAGPWDEMTWWLGCRMDLPAAAARRAVAAADARQDFADSGLTVLHAGSARAIVRTVRHFRHRPAQADLLHLDLWNGSTNVLRDSGSYSYNDPDHLGSSFRSVTAHNTFQFDGHDQMPMLARFLYGQWPRGTVTPAAGDVAALTASYQDWRGCRHERDVTLSRDRCLVIDRLTGFRSEAILRWHLCPDVAWVLDGLTCGSARAIVRVTGAGITGGRLVEGLESLFYNEATPLTVFEVVCATSATAIQTEILLS